MVCIKLEFYLPIDELVRLRDVLADDLKHDSRAQYLVSQITNKLETISRVYDESLLVPNDAEKELARKGNRIEAIRMMRGRTQAALKACKDALDHAVPWVLQSEVAQ
jgi:hypothetical protein